MPNFNIVKPQISQREFVQLAAEQFPAVAAAILDEDWAGMITMQVNCLTDYANACLATKRFDELQRLFRFFEAVLPKVDSDTDNAYYVSFLEHLELEGDTDDKKLARQLLSAEHLQAYYALRDWHKKSLNW